MREKLEHKKKLQEEQKISQMKAIHTTNKSKAIIEELKIQHFQDIFKRLDSDQDGVVSSQRIDLSQLEPELVGVLQQIFIEMEETGLTMNEEEFIDAAYRLYDVLPIPHKKALFNPKAASSNQAGNKGKGYQHNSFKVIIVILN